MKKFNEKTLDVFHGFLPHHVQNEDANEDANEDLNKDNKVIQSLSCNHALDCKFLSNSGKHRCMEEGLPSFHGMCSAVPHGGLHLWPPLGRMPACKRGKWVDMCCKPQPFRRLQLSFLAQMPRGFAPQWSAQCRQSPESIPQWAAVEPGQQLHTL